MFGHPRLQYAPTEMYHRECPVGQIASENSRTVNSQNIPPATNISALILTFTMTQTRGSVFIDKLSGKREKIIFREFL